MRLWWISLTNWKMDRNTNTKHPRANSSRTKISKYWSKEWVCRANHKASTWNTRLSMSLIASILAQLLSTSKSTVKTSPLTKCSTFLEIRLFLTKPSLTNSSLEECSIWLKSQEQEGRILQWLHQSGSCLSPLSGKFIEHFLAASQDLKMPMEFWHLKNWRSSNSEPWGWSEASIYPTSIGILRKTDSPCLSTREEICSLKDGTNKTCHRS